MKSFNLTGWALKHKQLIYYFMAAIFLMGVYSYQNLGRMEDPDFVIRQMVVSAVWPGASAAQVEEQVTDKIEKKLQDTPGIDYISSYSKPGQAVIFVYLKETVPEKDVRPTWLEVRNLVNDMKSTLPTEVQGLYFNDRFDDVYGSIYALTSDGFSYEEMRSNAEKIRRELLTVKNVKKVELIGVQEEKVYVEIESSKLAQLGIDPALIASTISGQNAMKKRVSLARAIALEPDIVLYDEPTAGLDPIMANIISELILKTKATLGVTSLLVTHEMAITAEKLSVTVKGEKAEINGNIDFTNRENPAAEDLAIQLEKFDVSKIIPASPVAGAVSGNLVLNGTKDKILVKGNIFAPDLVIAGENLTNVSVPLSMQDDKIIISDATAQYSGGKLSIAATYDQKKSRILANVDMFIGCKKKVCDVCEVCCHG